MTPPTTQTGMEKCTCVFIKGKLVGLCLFHGKRELKSYRKAEVRMNRKMKKAITTAVEAERERIRKLVAKDRAMFLRNNIVELMQLDEVKKIRKQLRKEILVDIDALKG